MDFVIDLDQAAAEIAARIPAWTVAGLNPGLITWRDEAASWPQPLETDRALVTVPDSGSVDDLVIRTAEYVAPPVRDHASRALMMCSRSFFRTCPRC
jgi:hypothetical protein